jgi:NTP pyrophosphatase (non-canonical NTP hydrolase)
MSSMPPEASLHSRHSERPLSLDAMGAELHVWARQQGFYDREADNPSLPVEKLMLIVSEVSETLEALRDDDRDHEAEEVADIFIRVLDYAAWRGISLDHHVAAKMEKNRARPRLHGRAF